MLQSVATFGTASRLRWQYGLENKPIAGKTGTSQFHADGWFIGFNPKLIAGAWVGGDSRLIRFRNFEWGQGAATALPVWGKFMQRIYADSTLTEYNLGQFPFSIPPLPQPWIVPYALNLRKKYTLILWRRIAYSAWNYLDSIR